MNVSWNGRRWDDDEFDNTLRAPFATLDFLIRRHLEPVTDRVFRCDSPQHVVSHQGIEYWFKTGNYTIHSRKVTWTP